MNKPHELATAPPFILLGNDVRGLGTVAEAIHAAGLDYNVGLGKTFIQLDDYTAEKIGTEASQIPDTFGTYRMDTGEAFAAVGSRYEVVQNLEVFSFFDSIIANGTATLEKAGSMGNGRTIYLAARIDKQVKVKGFPNENITTYVLLVNSHDGSSSVQLIVTPMRITCWNMLPAINGNKNGKIFIKHTASAHSKVEDAVNMISRIDDFVDDASDLYSELASIEVTNKEVRDLYNRIFLTKDEYEEVSQLITYRNSKIVSTRKKNILDDVNRAYFTGYGQEEILNTMYGAVNGVIHYFTNMKRYGSNEQKMTSMFLGGGDSRTIAKAIQEALIYKTDVPNIIV